MEIKVSRIKETRTFNGLKSYEEVDITNQVVMPIIDVERLDATLDTSSLTLINTEEHAIEPFTRMIIRIKNADNTTDNIYRLVERDDVTLYKYGANPKYQHDIQLVEITKWLERFEVDNTTITNFLAFLYTDDSVLNALGIEQNPTKTERKENVEGDAGTVWETSYNKQSQNTFYNTYIQGAKINTDMLYKCAVKHNYWHTIIPPLIVYPTMPWQNAPLYTYTITTPSGTTTSLIGTKNYTLSEVGTYTIQQVYRAYLYGGDDLNIYSGENIYFMTFTWQIKVIESTAIEKLPTKYTLSQVVDVILNKVGNETTIIRENIDEPMFSLDPAVRAKFDTIIAPEFTFTQDTLFGVLSRVGEVAHAIPRLLPNPVQEGNEVDDYSDWNIITYDFLGGDEQASEGEVVVKGSYYDGNDYTTNYINNVQNSFQTNDADYICLTEPYDGGWISPRTEASDFLITNDEAVIKTSRPIQRIVSLECLWFDSENSSQVLDLTQHVREITDYNLMSDYATDNPAGSKQNYLYYTRGSNVIGGLTYQAPAMLSIASGWRKRTIENIIRTVSSGTISQDITIKDLKFRIKYVPFYDLKVKQYKPYVNDHSGNNELFYNQINTQTVDIESLGEAMKGALLRVSNEEPNITEYFANHNQCIKSGQLLDDTYYVYQVNKEINNNRVKATVQFSKDFNKWNAYVAIRKNYREWEISERESIETNPVYSNFCMVTDRPEFYALIGIYETEEAMTDAQLDALLPTPTEYSPAWQSADQFMVINKVGDTYTKCKTYDDHYTTRWSREQIYLKNGVLIINDKYLNTTETDNYYATLQNEKGVLKENFFTQLVARMSNINAPIGKIKVSNNVGDACTAYIQQKLGRDPQNGDVMLNVFTSAENPYWKYTYTTQWTGEEITKQQFDELTQFIMHKISWVVGTSYSNEWQGGVDYKQVKKSFILPCACFSLGNSIVFDFGAQDNYAMGTYVAPANGEGTQYNLLNPAQEQYVEYGDRFGKVENLELQYGFEDAINGAFDNQTSANTKSKELYSIDTAEVNTDNVVLDYKTNSDFEIYLENGINKVYWCFSGNPTLVEPIPNGLTLYMHLKDSNTLHVLEYQGTTKIADQDVTKEESATQFRFTFTYGYDTTTITVTPNTNGAWVQTDAPGSSGVQFNYAGIIIQKDNEYNAGTTTVVSGTDTYTITNNDKEHETLTLQLGTTNYYSYKTTSGMFRVNKDSRQSLQFTNQLHFITDNNNIWIGSALAKTMPFVGQLESGIYKMVGFTKRPSKFEIVPNPDDYEELTGNWTKWYSNKTYTMKLYGLLAQNDYKGVGILDNKNRLVLYYNKEVGTGEYTPTLYIRLRRKL